MKLGRARFRLRELLASLSAKRLDFVDRESGPDSVSHLHADCEGEAFGLYRAGGADRLSVVDVVGVGGEKDFRVDVATSSLELPHTVSPPLTNSYFAGRVGSTNISLSFFIFSVKISLHNISINYIYIPFTTQISEHRV